MNKTSFTYALGAVVWILFMLTERLLLQSPQDSIGKTIGWVCFVVLCVVTIWFMLRIGKGSLQSSPDTKHKGGSNG